MSDFTIDDLLLGPGEHPPPHPYTRISQSISYIAPESSEELALIRIFLGGVAITSTRDGVKINQQKNYSVLGTPSGKFSTRVEFEDFLTKRGIEPQLLDQHLRQNLKQSAYYAELCGEVLHFIKRTEEGGGTVAFLHAYRFLERLSFPLPMVYAARTRDFKNTYGELKAYFEGKDKGELGFFRKFCDSSLDATLLDATTVFDFSVCEASLRPKFFAVTKRLVEPTLISSETPNVLIEVSNRALIPLLITLRNRYFHFLSGSSDNINALEVSDSDSFFSVFNEPMMNWLALIYFEVLQHCVESRR